MEAIQKDVYCDFKILFFMYSYFQFCTQLSYKSDISNHLIFSYLYSIAELVSNARYSPLLRRL